MNKRLKQVAVLIFIIAITSLGGRTALGQGQNVAQIIASDARFGKFNWAIGFADVAPMLNGPGPYTIFLPSDDVMSNLSEDITSNPGLVRQFVLNHILIGKHDSAALYSRSNMKSAFGKTIAIQQNDGKILLNESVPVTQFNIEASNGVIHLINGSLNPHVALQQAAEDSSKPPAPTDLTLGSPEANPAYVSGGHVAYWSGVRVPSNACRGMTWVLLRQINGAATVGADRRTNPYRGDTSCEASLPILCLKRDFTPAPAAQYAKTWAGGQVRITGLIKGKDLVSRATADQHCSAAFGEGWRMAEFHDGNMGYGYGRSSGWSFSAKGGLPVDMRFWVAISNQPANPWNSFQVNYGPPQTGSSAVVSRPGEDRAYVDGERILPWQARNQGRSGCRGTTWVIHKQYNGLVRVGADAKTNPYLGDEPCSTNLPVLCIRVDGYGPPPSSGANTYSDGWSGGRVLLTSPVSGIHINTRDVANNACVGAFGSAWRMATHHDGSLGTGGTDGWAFWAYGDLLPGTRFWIGVNDQQANPWNANS